MRKFEGTTLEEFTKWYLGDETRLRFKTPKDSFYSTTDAFDSFIIYREGRFQVQFYIMHKEEGVPDHSHPGVEATICVWSFIHNKFITGGTTYDTQVHAGDLNFEHLTPALAIQRWDEGVDMSSVILQWCGPVTDEKHRKELEDYWGVEVGDYFDCRDVTNKGN